MKTLILFRGLPGSGKSTLASQLCKVVFAADDYFLAPNGAYQFDASSIRDAHKQCITNTEVALKHELDTVGVANTFTQQWEMQPYFELAAKYRYQISTVIVENRHNSSNSHGVPLEVLKIMAERFEVQLLPKEISTSGLWEVWANGYVICFREESEANKCANSIELEHGLTPKILAPA